MEPSPSTDSKPSEKQNEASMLAKPSASSSIDDEGTFIALAAKDSEWAGPKFINPKFIDHEDEEDVVVQVVDLESTSDNKQPLLLLFPDLEADKNAVKSLNSAASTTEVTKMLVGKKADFSFFKPSRKFADNLHQPDKLTTVNEEDKCPD